MRNLEDALKEVEMAAMEPPANVLQHKKWLRQYLKEGLKDDDPTQFIAGHVGYGEGVAAAVLTAAVMGADILFMFGLLSSDHEGKRGRVDFQIGFSRLALMRLLECYREDSLVWTCEELRALSGEKLLHALL